MAARVLGLKQRKQTARSAEGAAQAIRLGTLTGLRHPGVWVEWPGSAGPVAAQLAIAADHAVLQQAIETAQQVVLAFAEGEDAPLVIGIVGTFTAATRATQGAFVVEADADGQRVRLEAKEEVILQCGEASLTLKRNGRIVIKGAYVETYAAGTNRIKGGHVRIN
jgi:hypothetical protein